MPVLLHLPLAGHHMQKDLDEQSTSPFPPPRRRNRASKFYLALDKYMLRYLTLKKACNH